ncbi:hypothetical protein GCM10009736_26390 [Actinomadura bangladeshensis]
MAETTPSGPCPGALRWPVPKGSGGDEVLVPGGLVESIRLKPWKYLRTPFTGTRRNLSSDMPNKVRNPARRS